MENIQAPPVDGGSNPAPSLHFVLRGEPSFYVEEIPLKSAAEFVRQHHYSKVMPKLNKVVLGLFDTTNRLVGVITFGWGVRPQHTIRKIFPSLNAGDYLEIGKMCLLDELPRNSESRLISAAMRCLKQLRPNLKVVFTWADAIWGKPGYIYQASNFWFGGAISSEAYRDSKGQRVHPRQLNKFLLSIGEISPKNKGRYVRPDEVQANPTVGVGNWQPKSTVSGVRRPYPHDMERLKLAHIRGLQFRYAYFLCDRKTEKKLLEESPETWHRDYPKADDCTWTIKTGKEKCHEWVPRDGEVAFTGAFDTERVECSKTSTQKRSASYPKRTKKPSKQARSVTTA